MLRSAGLNVWRSDEADTVEAVLRSVLPSSPPAILSGVTLDTLSSARRCEGVHIATQRRSRRS